jgi:hypothetical protein
MTLTKETTMIHSPNSTQINPRPGTFRSGVVRKNIARAMVGRTVNLLVNAQTVAHGVVSGVLTEAGMPKLVVDGMRYDLNQILTATPSSFDPQPQLER